MIQINNVLVSDEIAEKKFVCNLNACKGGCCVKGDEGAPLEITELSVMEDIYGEVKDYITPEGRETIEKKGKYEKTITGYRTPLKKDGACVYVNFESNNIAYCGIERAHEEGKIEFQKPISCHLYPARVSRFSEFEAINYNEWDICDPACKLGDDLDVPVYEFLKIGLIRRFGKEFYRALELAVASIRK